jgi:predicted DNA-binding transcriptional regulator AlpA
MNKPQDHTFITEEYWERKEFAQVMGVDPRSVDTWEVKGIGPPRIKIGKRILYRKSSVMQWLATRETSRNRRMARRARNQRMVASVGQ